MNTNYNNCAFLPGTAGEIADAMMREKYHELPQQAVLDRVLGDDAALREIARMSVAGGYRVNEELRWRNGQPPGGPEGGLCVPVSVCALRLLLALMQVRLGSGPMLHLVAGSAMWRGRARDARGGIQEFGYVYGDPQGPQPQDGGLPELHAWLIFALPSVEAKPGEKARLSLMLADFAMSDLPNACLRTTNERWECAPPPPYVLQRFDVEYDGDETNGEGAITQALARPLCFTVGDGDDRLACSYRVERGASRHVDYILRQMTSDYPQLFSIYDIYEKMN